MPLLCLLWFLASTHLKVPWRVGEKGEPGLIVGPPIGGKLRQKTSSPFFILLLVVLFCPPFPFSKSQPPLLWSENDHVANGILL